MSQALPAVFSGTRRRALAGLAANGLGQGLCAASAALLTGQAFGPQALPLLWLGAGLAALASAAALLKAQEARLAESVGQDYATSVRMQLFEHLARADAAALGQVSPGSLLLRFVTDLNGLRLWASQGLARLWSCSALLFAALGLLAVQAPTLALAAALSILALGLLLALAAPRLRAAEQTLRRARGGLAGRAHRRLAKLARGASTEQAGRAVETIRHHSTEVAAAAVARARLRGLLRGLTEAGSWLALGGVLLAGRAGLDSGQLELPQVLSALTLAGLLGAPLAQLERALEIRHGHQAARAKLDRLLTLPPAASAADAATLSPNAGAVHA